MVISCCETGKAIFYRFRVPILRVILESAAKAFNRYQSKMLALRALIDSLRFTSREQLRANLMRKFI
jgi:hypothetical protein